MIKPLSFSGPETFTNVCWLSPSPTSFIRDRRARGSWNLGNAFSPGGRAYKVLIKSFHLKNSPLLWRMIWAQFTVVAFSTLLVRAMRGNLLPLHTEILIGFWGGGGRPIKVWGNPSDISSQEFSLSSSSSLSLQQSLTFTI